MKRARILVIEGTDGSGKETQSKKLYDYLLENGYKVKRYFCICSAQDITR